jgi:plastocyanin
MLAARTSRAAVAVAALLALVSLGACGKATRSQPTSKATPRGVPAVSPTVNPSPTAAPTASASGESAAPSASATSAGPSIPPNTVTTTPDNKFSPATLTVKKGTKVTWKSDQPIHSANSGTPPTVDAAGPVQAPIGFATYSVTFDKPGTYKYFCQPHASLGMTGEIVVT